MTERLVPLVQVVLEGFAELVLDDVRPYLGLNLSGQLLLLVSWLFGRF